VAHFRERILARVCNQARDRPSLLKRRNAHEHEHDYTRDDEADFSRRSRAPMKFNLPNLITLSRIPTMFLIVWLMYCQWIGAATLAFWIFIATAVGDWLDGYLARRQNLVSNFGKFMDALTDKILVIGLMVAFVEIFSSGLFLIMVLLTLCREFLVSGMRMVAATKGVVVAAERGGKAKTLFQLIAVGFLLFVPMLEIDIAPLLKLDVTAYTKVLSKIGYLLFVIATILTVISGFSYAFKYQKVFSDTDT
jgi:CDP-diacylglycerol--glycerol-3-phosphate 3-phosphatidyltransferase